jgi:AraC family transcriptional regulator, L-rhamnose operon transcriptional activator RhaR
MIRQVTEARDLPIGTLREMVYLTGGTVAYAGRHRHEQMHPVHTHSFVEIAVTIGGTAVHHCLAGRRPLVPGDVVLLRPGVWHGYEECDGFELYNCCFGHELLQQELAWTRKDPLLSYFLWTGPYSMQRRGTLSSTLDASTFGECLAHLEALDRLRGHTLATHRGDLIGRLSLLLSHLARAVAADHGGVVGRTGTAHPAVGEAIRLLEDSLDSQWTLTSLAEQLHLAPGSLVRLFKSATGLPPMAFLARRRAETAAVLLLHTDQPMTRIGQAVGWPDQNYFARRFRAHYGLTATAYRKAFADTARRLAETSRVHNGSGGRPGATEPWTASSRW